MAEVVEYVRSGVNSFKGTTEIYYNRKTMGLCSPRMWLWLGNYSMIDSFVHIFVRRICLRWKFQ